MKTLLSIQMEKPTRTFDYIPDATVGYIKCAVYGKHDVFNIGADSPELSILQLAELYKKIGRDLIGYSGNIVFKTHSDKDYLIDNPNRRCPNITKAKQLLGYEPQIHINEGIGRYIQYLIKCDRSEFEW